MLVSSVCQSIQNKIDTRCILVSDVKIPNRGYEQKKHTLPVVLVNDKALMVFVSFDNCGSECYDELKNTFRRVLSSLVELLDVSMSAFMLFGCGVASEDSESQSVLCSFNIYNDRIIYFSSDEIDDFISGVSEEFSYRQVIFDEKELLDLAFKLELTGGSEGSVKIDSEGNSYVKKRGRWFLASKHDSDDVFRKVVFFGTFGIHKFLDNKKILGLIYFCTCGFLGVGWFFDCLALIAGVYKDSEGKYLLPLTDRKSCLLKFLCGGLVTAIYILLYLLVFRILGDIFSSVLYGVLNSNSENIANLIGEEVSSSF